MNKMVLVSWDMRQGPESQVDRTHKQKLREINQNKRTRVAQEATSNTKEYHLNYILAYKLLPCDNGVDPGPAAVLRENNPAREIY